MASSTSDGGDSGGGRFFRRFATATAGLTFALLLIGIYTAVSGSGLACEARWPTCDGWMGLFPATLPSFIEWFHRLVAMIVGFVVLGQTAAAWRGDHSRSVRAATTLALLLLPTQIVLGALTVTRYQIVILSAHFLFGAIIFGLLAAAAAFAARPRSDELRRRAALASVALVPVVVVATPFVLVSGSLRVHLLYYAVGFLAFATLLALAIWSAPESEGLGSLRGAGRIPAAALGSALLLLAILLQGRLALDASARPGLALAGGLVGGLALAAAWWTLRDAAEGLLPSALSTR